MTAEELARRAEEAIAQARMLAAEARRLRQLGSKGPKNVTELLPVNWFGPDLSGGPFNYHAPIEPDAPSGAAR